MGRSPLQVVNSRARGSVQVLPGPPHQECGIGAVRRGPEIVHKENVTGPPLVPGPQPMGDQRALAAARDTADQARTRAVLGHPSVDATAFLNRTMLTPNPLCDDQL